MKKLHPCAPLRHFDLDAETIAASRDVRIRSGIAWPGVSGRVALVTHLRSGATGPGLCQSPRHPRGTPLGSPSRFHARPLYSFSSRHLSSSTAADRGRDHAACSVSDGMRAEPDGARNHRKQEMVGRRVVVGDISSGDSQHRSHLPTDPSDLLAGDRVLAPDFGCENRFSLEMFDGRRLLGFCQPEPFRSASVSPDICDGADSALAPSKQAKLGVGGQRLAGNARRRIHERGMVDRA